MAKADTAKVTTTQTSPVLLSLPPIAIEKVLCLASFSGALAACSCRALRDTWRRLTGSNPKFAASALIDRFQSVDAAAVHLYRPDSGLLGDRLVKANIAPPAPGLLDAVASPLHFIMSALLHKRPSIPKLGYLTATGASDGYTLALLRHLSALRESAGREADHAAANQTSNNGDGGNANQGGPVAGQEQAVRSVTPFPRSVVAGAAFAGHDATVLELLKRGADPILEVLPGAVRAGNARLCAALLEGGRMAGAACQWSTAAGGDVLGIRRNPSGFVDSYASSKRATRHMASIYLRLLPLTYIDPPLGLGGGKGGVRGSGGSGGGSNVGGHSSACDVCAGRISAQGLFQRAVDGWCSGDAGPVQSAEDVAAALAAARAAAEQAADTALGDSNPLLPLFVQSSTAAAAAATAAATAAALAALTPPETSYGGCSSSSSGSGGRGDSAHQSGQACAFLSSTTNHAAVRQLLLQWRPAEWQVPPPQSIRAATLPHAAAVGAWPVVSELLRAGVDPRETVAPATLLYLALVQGRGAMAAWLVWRLLAQPARVHREIVGAATAALVTRIMGIASPLQLLVHHKYFEPVLWFVGHIVLYPGLHVFLQLTVLPTYLYPLWSLYVTWLSWSMCRAV